jgi:mercuric ion transport protein
MTDVTAKSPDSSLLKTGLAALVTTIGASLCCVGPLVLISLGIGGTWISYLTAFEPYQPVFVGLTLVFIFLAFRKLYLLPSVCLPGTPCADPRTVRNQRIIFWVATVILITLLTFPFYGASFFE